jgi:glycosyltransferase involved in cell wall biosynthesis
VAAFQPYVGALCRFAGIRAPWLLVTGEDPRRWRDRSRMPAAVFRAAFRHAALATGPSSGLIECHRRLGLEPAGGWRHIPNIVAEEAFVTEPPARRGGVLFVGRLVPEKRPMLAWEAAKRVAAPITFVGDGPERAALVEAARVAGREQDLEIRPFTPKPWRLYAAHRALILTSRYETFANVLVESLAAGTPVVSVDCDFGPREILAGAQNSALVEDSVESLAAALGAVLARTPSAQEAAECRRVAGRYRSAVLTPLITAALTAAATPDRQWR